MWNEGPLAVADTVTGLEIRCAQAEGTAGTEVEEANITMAAGMELQEFRSYGL